MQTVSYLEILHREMVKTDLRGFEDVLLLKQAGRHELKVCTLCQIESNPIQHGIRRNSKRSGTGIGLQAFSYLHNKQRGFK